MRNKPKKVYVRISTCAAQTKCKKLILKNPILLKIFELLTLKVYLFIFISLNDSLTDTEVTHSPESYKGSITFRDFIPSEKSC